MIGFIRVSSSEYKVSPSTTTTLRCPLGCSRYDLRSQHFFEQKRVFGEGISLPHSSQYLDSRLHFG
jgi:hypothetical protein